MTEIVEIWNDNFQKVYFLIESSLENSNFVAMDTEFPGTVTKLCFENSRAQNLYYQTLRLNVESLQLIQLGISFGDEVDGEMKIKNCLQFNFEFTLSENGFAQDSIDLLLRSGVDFEKHKKKGVSLETFTKILLTSGLIFNKKIIWISFHSGYDFGYLVKIVTKKSLPKSNHDFLKLVELYFPTFYDVKYLNLFTGNFVRGLNKLADKLKVDRIGQIHQAGSDSFLTLLVFEKLKKTYFNGVIEEKFKGILFGLNSVHPDEYVPENEYVIEDIFN